MRPFPVSIHAPAKGATTCNGAQHIITTCFNPRAREGRDGQAIPPNAEYRFQSTRPRRARPTADVPSNIIVFQSTRPRRARRKGADDDRWLWPVSIHAPAKGATRAGADALSGSTVSIHAPAKGATVLYLVPSRFYLFQSTRPRRARLVGFGIYIQL